jgi:hypothetical protein
MLRQYLVAGALSLAIGGAFALGTPADADTTVKTGVLTCNVDSGWGFVFGSSRDLKCNYSGSAGRKEHYSGHIAKYGVDIGYLQGGVIVWAVLAPTNDLAAGALAGDYGGATGGAAVGVGGNANVLLGGFKNSITLQPLSLEGDKGLNVAAGIASITLHAEP